MKIFMDVDEEFINKCSGVRRKKKIMKRTKVSAQNDQNVTKNKQKWTKLLMKC